MSLEFPASNPFANWLSPLQRTNFGNSYPDMKEAEIRYALDVQQASQQSNQRPAEAALPPAPPATTSTHQQSTASVDQPASTTDTATQFSGASFNVPVRDHDTQEQVVERGLVMLAESVPLSAQERQEFVADWTAKLHHNGETGLYDYNHNAITAAGFGDEKHDGFVRINFTEHYAPDIVADLQNRLAFGSNAETIRVTTLVPMNETSVSDAYAASIGYNASDQRQWSLSQQINAQISPNSSPVTPLIGQISDTLQQVRQSVQPVINEVSRTANGTMSALLEDNGLLVDKWLPDLEQNQFGRALGHSFAAAQTAVELSTGAEMMICGGGEALITSPVAATGLGAILPAAGAATAGLGAVVTTHGVLVGMNTLHNIFMEDSNQANGNVSSSAPSRTKPSLEPDPARKPRGTPERVMEHPFTPDEIRNARDLTRQNEAADTLSRAGYDVEHQPTVNAEDLAHNPSLKPNMNPDYRIEGEIFDCYTPNTSNARNIFDRVQEKFSRGQASRIVLNLDESSVTLNALRQELQDNPVRGLQEVIVVRSGQVVPLFPF